MNKKKKVVLKKHRKNKARIRSLMQNMVSKKKTVSVETAAKKTVAKKTTAKKPTAKKPVAKKKTTENNK